MSVDSVGVWKGVAGSDRIMFLVQKKSKNSHIKFKAHPLMGFLSARCEKRWIGRPPQSLNHRSAHSHLSLSVEGTQVGIKIAVQYSRLIDKPRLLSCHVIQRWMDKWDDRKIIPTKHTLLSLSLFRDSTNKTLDQSSSFNGAEEEEEVEVTFSYYIT